MKFALLGSDTDSLALLTAALAAGHELVWVGDVPSKTVAELPNQERFPTWLVNRLGQDADDPIEDPLRIASGEKADHDEAFTYDWQKMNAWQILLDRQFVDLVIVGHGHDPPELRTEQLSNLARHGVAVLSTHPVVPSVLSYFEIDMARDENGTLFRHYHPTTEHPIVAQLSAWTREGHPQLGKIQQIVCQRKLADRSRERVLWYFARDVLLLAHVGGRLDRLGALGTPAGDATYAALSVQMTGHLERAVHWSVGPDDHGAGLELALVGEQGRLLLRLDEVDQPQQLLLSCAGKQEELPWEPADYDPAGAALEAMCRELSVSGEDDLPLADKSVPQTARDRVEQDLAQQTNHSTWRQSLLAMELTDTIEISLRRGRMIEVHHQQLTEHMAFKGMMSAVGCGLLMVLPMLLLVLGWIMGELGFSIAHYWPHGLLLVLGLFLALQVLPWLLYPKEKSGS